MTGWTCVRHDGGAAILEFALALPILLALLAGAAEIGRALLYRQAMVEAVRSGARYLARVPDPACRVGCAPGAARAIRSTVDRIAEGTGLPRSAIDVSSSGDAASDTVAVQARATMGVDLLRLIGFGPTLTLTAHHQERRIGE